MNNYRSKLVDITVTLKHETPLAILISDEKQEVWIPKSQCEFQFVRNSKKQVIEVTLPEWLAQEKGLI